MEAEHILIDMHFGITSKSNLPQNISFFINERKGRLNINILLLQYCFYY